MPHLLFLAIVEKLFGQFPLTLQLEGDLLLILLQLVPLLLELLKYNKRYTMRTPLPSIYNKKTITENHSTHDWGDLLFSS